MAKRLYFAKTEREDIFQKHNIKESSNVSHRLTKYTNMNLIPEELKRTGFHEDIKNHREIRISVLDKFLLFFSIKCKIISKCFCWKKKTALMGLYKKAKTKILRDLNVYHLIKRLN